MAIRQPGVPVVLVVDDESMVNELLVAALQFNGFAVRSAANGTEALNAVETERPDIVVLDVNMPDMNGFDVCRRLRAFGHTVPVVFLTARNESLDLRTGFEQGGDDYLTKPFRVEELVLRLKAILRRTGMGEPPDRLVCGDLTIDEASMQVTRGATPISLSRTEFRLLTYLVVNQGRVVSKYQILDAVWGDVAYSETSLVETYIGYLRRKIDRQEPIEGSLQPLIHTIRGAGYMMRPPSLAPGHA